MSVLEIILDWVIDPLLDMVDRWHISGKWHLSYLFPVVTALGALLWWLGDHYNMILLLVFGVLTTVMFGLFSIVTFIPREVEAWKELKDHTSPRASKVETHKNENEEA